jgi:hypothetical protein
MAPLPIYYNWNGFYIGGNLGGAWTNGALTDNVTGVSLGGGNQSGFIGGGQIGYNWQFAPQWVFGVEWMFDGMDISHSGTGVTVFNNTLKAARKAMGYDPRGTLRLWRTTGVLRQDWGGCAE